MNSLTFLRQQRPALTFLDYLSQDERKKVQQLFYSYISEVTPRPFLSIDQTNPALAKIVKIQRWWLREFSRDSLFLRYHHKNKSFLPYHKPSKNVPLKVVHVKSLEDLKQMVEGLKEWIKNPLWDAEDNSKDMAQFMIDVYERDQNEGYDQFERLEEAHISYLIDDEKNIQAFCRLTYERDSVWHIEYLATAPQNTRESTICYVPRIEGCGSALINRRSQLLRIIV